MSSNHHEMTIFIPLNIVSISVIKQSPMVIIITIILYHLQRDLDILHIFITYFVLFKNYLQTNFISMKIIENIIFAIILHFKLYTTVLHMIFDKDKTLQKKLLYGPPDHNKKYSVEYLVCTKDHYLGCLL